MFQITLIKRDLEQELVQKQPQEADSAPGTPHKDKGQGRKGPVSPRNIDCYVIMASEKQPAVLRNTLLVARERKNLQPVLQNTFSVARQSQTETMGKKILA